MAEHSTIARPYAEALFESVRDDARGLEYWSEVMSLLAQVSGMEDVREALGDPRLEDAQRIDLLTGLVPQALPEQAANLVALDRKSTRLNSSHRPLPRMPYHDRKSTRLNSSHRPLSRMPSSA